MEGRGLFYSQVLENVLSPHRATGEVSGSDQEVEDESGGKPEPMLVSAFLWERQGRAEQAFEDYLV